MIARYKTCDGPGCGVSFDTTTGMDHWFEATEFDTDSMDEREYCSRECLIRDQQTELRDGVADQDGAEQCPNCGSEDNWVGFIADYDVRCNDCRHLWDIRTGEEIEV